MFAIRLRRGDGEMKQKKTRQVAGCFSYAATDWAASAVSLTAGAGGLVMPAMNL